jgi:tRNA dimethylallyltransferase
LGNATHTQHDRLVVALVGPTASGKSDVALRLASHLPIEIINADSRQVYRYMDIGTGKPSAHDRSLLPHHVFDVVNPDQGFSLADYLRHARAAVDAISTRGHLPVVVGGSGQYVWSLIEGWQIPEVPPAPAFRARMELYAVQQGHRALHEQLASLDPEAARAIQPTNVRRVIRALELYHATGIPPTRLRGRRAAICERLVVIGLSLERSHLYSRIDLRIATMVRAGFAAEVRTLLAMGYDTSLPSMSSIGYREMAEYVVGAADLDTAVARVRHETRRLVRRQHAWFRPSDERIMWVDASDPEATVHAVTAAIQDAE